MLYCVKIAPHSSWKPVGLDLVKIYEVYSPVVEELGFSDGLG